MTLTGGVAGFSAMRWEAARRRVVARAFRTVPYYREQWAVAGRVLDEPVPVAAPELTDQLFRLCPLGRPFQPSREPTLWSGDGTTLRAAVRAASGRRRVTVLEVRAAMIDRRRLGPGLPYAALLSAKADVMNEERRAALNRRAAGLATSGAVIVGTREELADVLPEIGAAGPHVLHRAGLSDALGLAGPVVAHDPVLGYYGARVPSCGHLHLLWRHFHARVADGALQLTALRRRRPVLCNVIPADAAGTAVERCPSHRTPVLTTA